jgi:hypothetical protein
MVHDFTLWDHFSGKFITLAYKCTTERIEKLGGEMVPNTAEVVEESQLEEDGVFISTECRPSDTRT